MSSTFPQKSRALIALHAQTLIVTLAASSASTPLYSLYRAQWHFSPFFLTVAFAAYAITLLLTLLVAGRLSDHTGRRPVILAALLLAALSMALFLCAGSIGWLIAARLVLGIASGLAASTLSAAIIDISARRGALINSVAPLFGMGVGALGGGLLAQYAPVPLRLVYALLLALFVLQFIRTWFSAETAPPQQVTRWKLALHIGIPAAARSTFLLISPVNIAVWGLCGFYLSLMPSLVLRITGITSLVFGGLIVALLSFSGVLAILIARRQSAHAALTTGVMAMIPGMALILTGILWGSVVALLAGSAFAGFGLGAGFLGAINSMVPLAAPQQRAGLMATFYIECYLSNALPAMAAGLLVQMIGLIRTAEVMSIFVIVLVLLAAVAMVRANRRLSVSL
ncbi:hypothetical protein BTJ39_02925 [Izhakiella australiensis]|uniref:Major facilitator superfamily (MFS) profile domain-containing protein n=1 Tax=Izhakiella australiensis TaxID=1926881 RepID=A0A1S8YTG6_9GAMM|nr:MFS transporter [Izhakiella australiensis]OON42122.1 hypothetical protein BTJ39_02925 [Izhakiella australiensis]